MHEPWTDPEIYRFIRREAKFIEHGLGEKDAEKLAETMKKCKRCNSIKPKTDFGKQKDSLDGLSYTCKACRLEICAAYRNKNPEKVKSSRAAYASENKDSIRAKQEEFRKSNPEKVRQSNRKYAELHPERVKASRAAYEEANKEKIRARRQSHRANHLQRILTSEAAYRANYPERRKAAQAAYRKSNPDMGRIDVLNRLARKKAAGGKLSKGLSEKLFKLQMGLCPCCKQSLGNDYHLDHKIPLILGGSNTDDNIQLLRAVCNLKKGKKHPVEFMQSKGFLL